MKSKCVLCLFYISSLLPSALTRTSDTPEGRLYRSLLDGYVPIPPTRKDNQPIPVHLEYYLLAVRELDGKEQTLNSWSSMTLSWQYEYFKWKPDEYNGTNQIKMQASLIWRPSLSYHNGINGQTSEMDPGKQTVTIQSNGEISWSYETSAETACDVDIALFPLDRHECDIQLYSEDINISVSSEVSTMTHYMSNSEWTIEEISTNLIKSSKLEMENPVLEFKFRFTRRATTWLLTLVGPVWILSVCGLFIYFIPHDSGERLSLAVAVTLSFSVIMSVIADHLPQGSKTAPYVLVSLLASMAEQVLAILFSIITLTVESSKNLHLSSTQQTLVYSYIARAVRMGTPDQTRVVEVKPDGPPSDLHRHPADGKQVAKILNRFFFSISLIILVVHACIAVACVLVPVLKN